MVGALIVNAERVFVHRRGPQRAFLPDCWDVPGGHVEPGESLLEALGREVFEETGWQTDPGDPATGRREFDFLVLVDGDLTQPRLEVPKQIEFRWVGREDTALLDENRRRDDGLIRFLVELALSRSRLTS